IAIYEVHLGSWRRNLAEHGRYLTYRELADQLVPYVRDMGFTHIEAMPLAEYPFDGSWGYQPVSLFAPTSRYGTPDDFRAFVEACHNAGLGLLLDWVPGHFPNDAHGLGRFDGTALYEHADPRGSERCHFRGRGVDGLANGVTSSLCRRARLRVQMEHGVDARHPAIHVTGSDPSQIPSQRSHFRVALRVSRELYPPAQP